MDKLPSLIAPYLNANQLQSVITQGAPLIVQGWYQKRFSWGPLKNNLTFSTVIGQTRLASLASVVDRDSETPVRARPGLQKITGDIPAIKHYRFLKEDDARLILEMNDLNALNGGRLTDVINLVFDDVKYVADGVENRLDDFVAQALSKGYVELNGTNNPDGITQAGIIDFYLPDRNKLVSDADWTVDGTDIVKDIRDAVQLALTFGYSFSSMIIDQTRWNQMLSNTALQNFVKGFFNPGSNQTYALTLGNVNLALSSNLLPTFEICNIVQRVEVDGVQVAYKPWAINNVAFVPDGNLGIIHNARAIEDGLRPVTGVLYSKANRTLISKWSQNEPFREYTKAELNAFPGVELIDQLFIMRTDGTDWS